jgi:hypothetical protein
MKKGHYIWNRVERINKKSLPELVTDSFDNWVRDLKRDWRHLSESRKEILRYRVARERNKMNENLNKLGYEKYYN